MKRVFPVLLVLAVAAMIAPAFAQVGPPDTGSDQLIAVGSGTGAIKHVARAAKYVETHVGMPAPYDPEPGPMTSGSEMLPSRGTAIVAPRGGSFISPKKQADREIQSLIRKLG